MSDIYTKLFTNYDDLNLMKPETRNYTLDMARGLAVIFMVFVHVLMIYSTVDVHYSTFGYIVQFLGGPPAAPVFMFTMGIFFVFSRQSSDLRKNLKRGVKLILISIIFSFVRTDILMLLDGNITSFDIFNPEQFILFWEVDILQFAGWAYLFMSLIRHYIKKPIWWLSIAIAIMMISPILWGIQSDYSMVNWFLNYFWGYTDLVYFPVFGWLYFPLLGMVIGSLIQSSDDQELFYKKLWMPGLLFFIIGGIITLTNMDFHINDYYHSGQGAMIWMAGFIFLWIWILSYIIRKFETNGLVKLICYWGKKTTTIYIIHWLLISWGIIFLGYEQYNQSFTLVLMVFFLTVTHVLSKRITIKI